MRWRPWCSCEAREQTLVLFAGADTDTQRLGRAQRGAQIPHQQAGRVRALEGGLRILELCQQKVGLARPDAPHAA